MHIHPQVAYFKHLGAVTQKDMVIPISLKTVFEVEYKGA